MKLFSKLASTLFCALTLGVVNAQNVQISPPNSATALPVTYASVGGVVAFDVRYIGASTTANQLDLTVTYSANVTNPPGGPSGSLTEANVPNLGWPSSQANGCFDIGSSDLDYATFRYQLLWSKTAGFPSLCGTAPANNRLMSFSSTVASFPAAGKFSITAQGDTSGPSTAATLVVCQKTTVTTVTTSDVTEGATATFNVNFAAVPAGCGGFAIPVSLTTANKGAAISADGCANVADAATTCAVTVTTSNNNLPDGSLPVVLTVTNSTAASVYVSSGKNGTANILDDEVSASVVATTSAASESGTNGVITLSRGGSTTLALALTSAIGGSATFTADYSIAAGTCTAVSATASLLSATVPAGSPSCTVNVVPVNDVLVEVTENVTFDPPTGTNVSPAGTMATVTITDNDALPTVDITKAGACAEDASSGPVAPVTCTFTVAVTSNTSPVQTGNGLLVPYGLSGSATITTDYKVVSGIDCTGAALAATGSVQTVFGTPAVYTVCPVNDTDVESAETVTMTLTANAAAYTLTNASQTHSIADDDSAQTVTIAAAGSPAEAGSVTGTFTVTRAGGSRAAKAASLPVNAQMSGSATLGTTCTPGVDYTLTAVAPATYAAGVVTLVNAATMAVVTLTPCDDSLIDPAETATMTITAASAVPAVQYTPTAPTAATLTIIDDEAAVNAVAGASGVATNGSVPEGGIVRFSVSCPTLTVAATFIYTITPALTTGDAFVGGAATGSVTCPAAVASNVAIATTISTVNDITIGNNRSYTMTLSVPQSGGSDQRPGVKASVVGALATVIGNASATVNVLDDDVPLIVPTMSAAGLGILALLIFGFVTFGQRRRVD